jgi:hypothetical protein
MEAPTTKPPEGLLDALSRLRPPDAQHALGEVLRAGAEVRRPMRAQQPIREALSALMINVMCTALSRSDADGQPA